MISKIFHQTWKTKKLPNNEKVNSDKIKKIYNNYSYILWTDNDIEHFIRSEYSSYYNFFSQLTIIQKVDIVRYFWMYHFGGVYSDLDILYRKKIFYEKFNGVVFFEREWTYPKNPSIKKSVHNAVFASRPKHPIWLIIIDEIKKKYERGERNVFNLTGPNSISEIISRLKLTKKFKDIIIIPGKYIYQMGHSKHNGKYAKIEHLCYGSWNKK